MVKDFQLVSSVEIVQDDVLIDLHNCYGFSGLHLNLNEAMIGFLPDPIWGKGQRAVLISFSEVRYLEVNIDFSKFSHVNPQGLDLNEMGYKSPTDSDDNWLLSEDQANADDHLFFRLEADQYVRIYATRVNLLRAQMHVTSKIS